MAPASAPGWRGGGDLTHHARQRGQCQPAVAVPRGAHVCASVLKRQLFLCCWERPGREHVRRFRAGQGCWEAKALRRLRKPSGRGALAASRDSAQPASPRSPRASGPLAVTQFQGPGSHVRPAAWLFHLASWGPPTSHPNATSPGRLPPITSSLTTPPYCSRRDYVYRLHWWFAPVPAAALPKAGPPVARAPAGSRVAASIESRDLQRQPAQTRVCF